jgi:hypothetical protein
MDRSKRRRLGPSGWREVMRRFDASASSVQAFCSREGLSTASFYRWRERLQSEGGGSAKPLALPWSPALARKSEAGSFVDLGSLLGASGALELKLDLGGGVVLSLWRR